MNDESILAIDGLTLGATSAAIRKRGRLDLAVLLLEENSTVAGVFTQNNFRMYLTYQWGLRPVLFTIGDERIGQ